LSATSAVKYRAISTAAVPDSAAAPVDKTACVQARKLARSESGTPSSSQITVIGSGKANDSSRST
jgi:hypothetical protein